MQTSFDRERLGLGAWLLVALFSCALSLCLPASVAQAAEAEPDLSEAEAAIIVDSAGNVLYEKNPDEEINMASVTKVMTAVVALESGTPLDKVCACSKPDLVENAVAAGYENGTTSTFEDLLHVMLVHSANDAAYNVAVAVAGSEPAFVDMMNEKAEQLGMDHTHFENPHGLDADGHHSTVHDLAILARYAMTTQPFIADTVRMRQTTVKVNGVSETFDTSDELLGTYRGMLGIKTGAGDNVTAFMGCARRSNATLYTVVLGCSTVEGRFSDTVSLLDWAFDTYDKYSLADPDERVSTHHFAYDLAYSLDVSADARVEGLVWPAGGATAYARTTASSNQLLNRGQAAGSCLWRQDGRTVNACSYSASDTLEPSRSGFGLADRLVRGGILGNAA